MKILYTIFDDIAKQPIYVPQLAFNEGDAIRSFTDLFKKDGWLKDHKDNLSLYILGEYNEETMHIRSIEPKLLIKGSQI